MSEIDTGGPAFPRPFSIDDVDPDVSYPAHTGMTLRDYFAAKELSKTVGPFVLEGDPAAYERLAEHCYRMADAMLKARKQ